MSMMEFFVDSGGIVGGGLFKKFKTSFKKIVKGVGKKLGVYKDKAIELAKQKAKEELPAIEKRLKEVAKEHGGKVTAAAKERLQKEVSKAEQMGRELADDAMDQAHHGS